jgi:cytochrome P450
MQRANEFRPFSLTQALPSNAEEIPQTFEWFKQMRENTPILRDEHMPIWHAFRYEDVSIMLKDTTRFSSQAFAASGSFLADTLVSKDPPEHRKLRNLVNLAFTPRAVAHLADRITKIMQELLDQVRAKGEMDVVADVAFPLPARVIAEMLGVPENDWDIFQRWAQVDSMSPMPGEETSRVFQEMQKYFSGLLEERRSAPREDLLTDLCKAEIDGERLSEQELVSFCMLLLAAGQDTTKNLIANFFLTLADHPEDYAQLKHEANLLPNAIEELLRYLPPVWFLMRQTTTEVELSGVRIPANQMIMPWLASANRDSSQFPDADRFDIRRESNRHLTFGHGIHFCIGAPLARLEAKVAIPMMLEQLQNFQIVKNAPININAGIVFAITKLPATFKPY